MRRLVLLAVCALAWTGLIISAQQAPPPPPQQPTFRGEVDVIRLDVSVLDKDRRPVRGLKAEDFSVYEDGKEQRVVAVSEIDMGENDPAPSAWMRHATRDVSSNDLADQAGDGRLFAIIMDDVNVPWDDLDIIQSARQIGRYMIDGLSPSDIAAIIFARDAGKTQDFTDDRSKLVAAVDGFDPREPDWYMAGGNTYYGPGPGGGDMPQRFSPVLGRSNCQRAHPMVPTLHTVAMRMATVPNRRKTIVMVSVGLPMMFGSRDRCQQELADLMMDVFDKARRTNINIHSIDPAGNRGYEDYLQRPIRRGGRPPTRVLSQEGARNVARNRRDFLEIVANHTGARAIVNTDDAAGEIDQLFAEVGSYYLVGYQTSNGKPDGKFRRVEVKVKRPGASVRTRSGYYAPREGTITPAEQKIAPVTSELNLVGMWTPAALPLRAAATPIARAGTDGNRDVEVAVVLGVRLPAIRGTVPETLTLVRTVFDSNGRGGSPLQEKQQLTLLQTTGDELRYDVYQRLTLAPGRYQIRLNAFSAALDRGSSVFADIVVPDFTRSALSATGLVLGTRPEGGKRADVLAPILPVVPTSARDFAPGDNLMAFLRVFQGGTAPLAAVTIKTQVLDIANAIKLDETHTLAPESFDASRGTGYEIALPLAKLSRGPHLLSITASLPGGASVRRDLVFRVR